MGITFKENCPDIRNSKSLEVANLLIEYDLDVYIYDPIANLDLSKVNNKFHQVNKLVFNAYAGIIIAVAHDEFTLIEVNELKNLCIKDSIIFDVKNIYPSSLTDLSL